MTLFAEEDAVVGEHTDGEAADVSPARDESCAVERLELLELTAIEDACEHLAGLEGLAHIGARDAE